jgi:quinol monooxygenase YgiN
MTKVLLTGHIDVPADRFEQVALALETHIELTRQEEGCLSFEVKPDPKIKGRFNVSESFSSIEAFEAHQVRTKKSEWAQLTVGIARIYEIEYK